ncbi:MAG: ATP-binding cassette domain-containing protein [Actinomycetota bacterium]|jgi:ABC-type sulfate/molybdate transport systems ATPase subunit|nr:ATP-binding cassette domain-containing protein [Actinomycetota bacterium]
MTDAAMLEAEIVVARRDFDVAAELSIARGERLSLFGPSGAGKTTCLEAIAGVAPLRQGRVRLDGRLLNAPAGRQSGRRMSREQPAPARERSIAFVRQPTTLFPHLSVRANVTYAMGKATLSRSRSLDELLQEVGLAGLSGAMPEALSGGQQQRACLARAVARPFKALLLDEPFSAVDAAGREALRVVAIETAAEAGAAAVLVTHDLAEAQAFGHRLGIMDGGRLLQVGSSGELVRRPATLRVAELCGYVSFVRLASGRFWALHPDRFLEGALPDRGVVLTGTVHSIQPFGPRYDCELVLSGADAIGTGIVRIHVDSPPRLGEPWEVTAIDPPLVGPLPSAGQPSPGRCRENPGANDDTGRTSQVTSGFGR